MQQNIQNQHQEIYRDDEIDLFELFKTIWGYRLVVVLVSALFLGAGLAYVMLATPWYKANALVEIGYYKSSDKGSVVYIAKTPDVVQKLKATYVDPIVPKGENAQVKSVSEIKGNASFFNIEVLGRSNEVAKNEINRVLAVLKSEHQKILDGYISTQKVALSNIDREINFLKNNKIIQVEQNIKYIQNIQIPRLDRQIEYLQNIIIPSAQKNIEIIDSNTLPAIDKSIKFSSENIKNWEHELAMLGKDKSSAENLLLLQMREQGISSRIALAQQNLSTLEQQKAILVTQTKPNLTERIDRLRNVDLVNFEAEKDRLLSDKLPAIQRELANLQTESLGKLLDQKSIVELSLKPYSYQNTQIVADIITSTNPAKPKKLIILAVCGMLGFMMSLFGVLVYDAYKKRRAISTEAKA